MGAKLDTGVGAKRGVPDVNSEPNVIPFIDVMLVMLIIFMVTAPIAAVDVHTSLPNSEVVASKRPNKPVWVTIVDGDDCKQPVKGKAVQGCPAYFVMEEQVDVGAIAPKVMDQLRLANPGRDDDWIRSNPPVYVRASGVTQYANVLRVMNNLQQDSLLHVALVANDKHF